MLVPHLHLRTLGAAALHRLEGDGSTTTLLDSSKLLALLTYLSAAPARSATRDHLVHLLWADLESEGGRHALRHHLWLLKQKLGDEVALERAGETLTLRDPMPSDRDELLAASAEGELVRVVSLYRGDFFPDFAASGAQEFELWVERERTTLRSIFVRSGQIVVKQWLDLGRARDAAALARRVRDADPFNLAGWRLVLETLVASRDVVGAAVEVDALEHFVREEELQLDGATKAVVASIRHPAAPAAAPGESPQALVSRELVGREAEFAALVRRWEEASRRLQGVHLTGPAGIGKSRLLQEFAARLTAMRRDVVRARADWASRMIEWSFASDLIAQLCALPGALGVAPRTASVLVGLAPAASAVFRSVTVNADQGAETVARRGALRELLAAITEERPLALLLDDMHWCDATSRDVFLSALDGLDKRRLLVVIAERDMVAGDVPRSFATLPLTPLSPQAVTTLVASIAELPDAPWATEMCERLTQQSGGSPLHLLETLQFAMERGALRIDDGAWATDSMAALTALLSAGGGLRSRVSALTQRQRACASVLACVGSTLSIEVVAECAELPERAVVEVMGELERSGIVRASESGVAIAHDEIAEMVRKTWSEAESEQLFGRIGAALAREASDRLAMVRAAALLARANRPEDLAELLGRFVRLARRAGDRRLVDRVAADLLGSRADARGRRVVIERLPLRMRLGLDLRHRRVAAAAALVIGASVVAWTARTTTAAPVAAYLTMRSTDSTGRFVLTRYALPVSWATSAQPLRLHRTGPPVRIDESGVEAVVPPPVDSLPYLIVRQTGDSGLTDIYEYRPGQPMRRLTSAVGDDANPTWAPDGSAIAFTTARWDSLGRRDVAVLDPRSGAVTRVTATGEREDDVYWSPDGTRLAFTRRSDALERDRLCIASIDGKRESCQVLPRQGLRSVGWLSDESLLLTTDVLGEQDGTIIYDLPSGSTTAISSRPGLYRPVQGVGIVCYCVVAAGGRRQWTIGAASGAWLPKVFTMEGLNNDYLQDLVVTVSPPSALIESLVLPKRVAIPAGVPYRLFPYGRRNDGGVAPLWAEQWVSLDTAIVSVNDSGELVGRSSPGRARVRVSAGGWRSDSIEVTVLPSTAVRLLHEDWSAGVTSAWRLFGEPVPVVRRHPDGTWALKNNGDGEFTSGVYSRASFALQSGLAVRTRLASHITMTQWQMQRIGLDAGFDDAFLAKWNHRDGYLWSDGRFRNTRGVCQFTYPSGPEGSEWDKWVTASDGRVGPVPPKLRTGAWYDVTLQWLPDGRCAVLLDGKLLAVSRTAERADSVHFVMWGNSVKTDILLGPLEIWTGVLPEVAEALRKSNE